MKKAVIRKTKQSTPPNQKPAEKELPKKTVSNPLLLKELDSTARIAHHYGFTPIVTQRIIPNDKIKTLKEHEVFAGESEERTAIMRLFHEQAFARVPQPPMLYVKKPFLGSDIRKKPNVEMCGLEILNVSKATAEALIIKTAWTMLEEMGSVDMRVEINSIGDKESFARFERELHTYFRKYIHTLSGEWRQKFKENNLDILTLADKVTGKEDVEFCQNAPKPMSTLSEPSRIHFKEVLEFLETSGVAYQIQPTMLANKCYASHTVFEIKGKVSKDGAEILLAHGGRYNYLARKIGFKKDVPACGATVYSTKKAGSKGEKTIAIQKMKRPRIYMVQLGNLARLQALNIIELLRTENIPAYHALTKENIGGQLAAAEYLQVSHLLIVGQKEALESSIVVRSTDLRAQETVNVCDLTDYLKKVLKN